MSQSVAENSFFAKIKVIVNTDNFYNKFLYGRL